MNFLNPWGMLLILCLPVLVIIYLIKAHREDKKVSSTYIWKLSEKFNKKRLPISRFNKILLFLLRLLAICLGAFLVSRPALTDFPNKDYILIVDSSASMMTPDKDGTTRFEKAIKELENMSGEVNYGHTVSIISASSDPICVLKKSSSRGEIDLAIKNLSCTIGSCDFEKSFELAGELSMNSKSPEVYIYTDIDCVEGNSADRVRLVNLSSSSDVGNISLESLTYYSDKSGICEFHGTLSSTFVEGSIVVGLRIDDKVVDAVKVELNDSSETYEAVFKEELTSFGKAEIFIEQEDAIAEDNSYILLNYESRNKTILLVGSSTFYLDNALSVIGNCSVTRLSSLPDDEEAEPLEGYDIYIFDGVNPKIIPSDGSSIFLGCEKLPNGITFAQQLSEQIEVKYNSDCSSGIGSRFVYDSTMLIEYKKLLANASWDVLLYADENPVLAVKSYQSGYTHTVFAFDLHDSNIALKPYFIPLLNEIISFSSPEFVSSRDVSLGYPLTVSRPAGCISLNITDPDGEKYILDHNPRSLEYVPDKVGIYSCVGLIGEEQGEAAEFYSHIPVGEFSLPDLQSLPVIPYDMEDLSGNASSVGALSEISFFVAVALLVALLIEWGVYCYEQY